MKSRTKFFSTAGVALSCLLTFTGCIGPEDEDRNAQAVVEPNSPNPSLHDVTGAVEHLSIDMLAGKTFRALNRDSENLETLSTPAGELLTLAFAKDHDGTIHASPHSGCNFMSSPAIITSDGILEAHEMMSTAMLCEDWRGEAESWLSGLVQDSPSISYINQGDHYTLILQTPTKFMEFLEEAQVEFAQINAWSVGADDGSVDTPAEWRINVDENSQNCLVFEHPNNDTIYDSTYLRVLPVFQDSRTARTLSQHLGETLTFLGEGVFDNVSDLIHTLSERMPNVGANVIRIPESCPTDIPLWVVFDRVTTN